MNSSQTPLITYTTYKQKTYESKTIHLNAPLLHIGAEVSRLNPYEYVETASKIYFPHQEALSRALLKQGGSFLQDYLKAIDEKRSINSLLKQAFGEDWVEAKSPEGIEIFPDVRPKWTLETGQSITDLRPMIRNGMGELYLPGSSIKGSIRTAIVYYLLKHSDRYQVPSQNRLSAIEQKLRQKLDNQQLNNRRELIFLDDQLFMDNLFSGFSLHYQGRTITTKSSQNTDFLRCLIVSDSQPLKPKRVKLKNGQTAWRNIPIVAEVIVSSHFPNGKAKYKAPLYAEIVHHVSTQFTITLDTEMLSWFEHDKQMKLPFQNLAELFKICEEFAQDQWDKEVQYWENISNNRHQNKNLNFDLIWDNYYSKEKCPYSLRLGWGSGLFGTTIDGLLPDEMRSELRDVCGIAAPNFEAPKSRRTVVNSKGEIRYVPGWVNFKE